jgi:DNA adenine methylase
VTREKSPLPTRSRSSSILQERIRAELRASSASGNERMDLDAAEMASLLAVAAVPHPIPYQGSKRRLAPQILDFIGGRDIETLYEPFAGSAAFTIAASSCGLAKRYVIGDSLEPLMDIWSAILTAPTTLASAYEDLWEEQSKEPREHFNRVRSEYNDQGGAARLLYLLARCVKNAPRWNKRGGFSQSADHRRKGMHPSRMGAQINGCHGLLSGNTTPLAKDAIETSAMAGSSDLVYLDPPWQGTSSGSDTRYHKGFDRTDLEAVLASLNVRRVPWVLSYDGRHGEKTYGPLLPQGLFGAHVELAAGRSSQATLSGRSAETFESLYLSPILGDEIPAEQTETQLALAF